AEVEGQLKREGAWLDAMYICTHHPTAGAPPYRLECECRKPKPSLLCLAAAEHGLELTRSVMVGDKPSDVAAGPGGGGAGGGGVTGRGRGGCPRAHRVRARRVGIPASRVDGQARPRRRGSPRRSGMGPWPARRREGYRVFPLKRLKDIVAGFGAKRVVVVGDLIADEYLYGQPSRI